MDGLDDDSRLIPLILFSDFIDNILERPHILVICLCAVILFLLFGRWHDLIPISIYITCTARLTLLSWSYKLWENWAFAKLLLGILALWFSHLMLTSISPILGREDNWAPTFLIPSRITHMRYAPRKHSFTYPYLLVGISVGLEGNIHGKISVDESKTTSSWMSWLSPRRGWFRVDSADYLQRGSVENGLHGKLKNYLKTQGVDPAFYPHAFHVSAPRVFGYQFNPVSIWYLYSAEKHLSAILLEVNNIFGERRPYLVLRDCSGEANQITHTSMLNCNSLATRLKGSWDKDFHVSPFNSRKGSYSLLASDPLGTNMEGFRGIDVTINLVSSKRQPKLTVRLFTESDALNPSTMQLFDKTKFLMRWFWVGFLTFPRIVKEIATLFFHHRLHIWYRPEPLKGSLGRLANGTEKRLEAVFRRYLQYLVEKSPRPLSVRYVPSGITDTEEIFISHSAHNLPTEIEYMQIKVLTPVFYTRFVFYAHDFEGIFSELVDSCTIWVDKPEVLPKVFLKMASPPLHAPSFTDYLAFKLIQSLRRRPRRIVRPMNSSDIAVPAVKAVDIRGFRISSMDGFVLSQHDTKMRSAYRSIVSRLMIADRLFLGSMQTLNAVELALRFCVIWWFVPCRQWTP